MSNLPTVEQASQAQAYMLEQIHVPAFFEKLAANGIEPRNEAEAQQLLQLGAVLGEAKAQGQVKSAGEAENPLLTSLLSEHAPQQPARDVDAFVKENADKLVANSELARNAALVYGHAAMGGELAEEPAAE